jgi:quercetin dioxygenase-like cupin family protein
MKMPGLMVVLDDQPPVVEIKMADGIFIKQMFVRHAGSYVPQHSHSWDHVSMVATGAVRVWRDGVLVGDYEAPTGVMIPARCKHTFLALKNDTTVYCIHRIDRTGAVDIEEEHQIEGLV